MQDGEGEEEKAEETVRLPSARLKELRGHMVVRRLTVED